MSLASQITALATRIGQEVKTKANAVHTHVAADLSNSTATGRSLITAADAAASRTVSGCAAASHTHVATTDLTATGTKDSTTFLRGDNTWATMPGMGTNFTNGAYGIVAATSKANSATNNMYFIPIVVPTPTRIQGFFYRKGTGTVAANVIGALYDSAGTRLLVSNTFAQGTTASAVLTIPFTTSNLTVAAGLYWIGLIGSSTSVDFYGWATAEYLGAATNATQGSFAAPASFTPGATNVRTTVASIPMISTY